MQLLKGRISVPSLSRLTVSDVGDAVMAPSHEGFKIIIIDMGRKAPRDHDGDDGDEIDEIRCTFRGPGIHLGGNDVEIGSAAPRSADEGVAPKMRNNFNLDNKFS